MRIASGHEAAAIIENLAARGAQFSGLELRVHRIVKDVRRKGDQALRRYAEKWDGLAARKPLRVSAEEMRAAQRALAPALRKSLSLAAENIRRFCEWQKPRTWMRTQKGMSLGQFVKPLESVGCYVPGGRYPLVSTVLMTVIPAQVAGVKNIRVVSPKPTAEVLGAAAMLGVKEFYRVGGAQAIAALAYGTESIARVDKIVGPGNAFVTVAKKLVSFDCAIDFLAGPTEAVIMRTRGIPNSLRRTWCPRPNMILKRSLCSLRRRAELAKAVAGKRDGIGKRQSDRAAIVRQSTVRFLSLPRARRHGNGPIGWRRSI